MFRVLSASSPWGMPVLWCSFLGAVVQKQVLFAAWVQLSQVCCWLQLGSFPGPWAECLRVFARDFVGLMVFVVGISVGWAVLEGPPCSFGRFPSPSRLHRTVRHVFSSLLPVPIPVVRVGMVSFWPQHLPLRVKGHVPPCCNTWLAACFAKVFFFTVSVGTDCGFSSSLVVGSCVLHRRPSYHWAGLVPIESVWVCRCANTARYRYFWCIWPFAEVVWPL